MPKSFCLHQNYLNPFNPTTTIVFSVGTYNYTSLRVYDLLGGEIVKLVNETKPAGSYKVEWNAENVTSGIYFYKLELENFSQVKKMLLLK